EHAPQGDLGRADVLNVNDDVAEGAAEDALLQSADGTSLQDAEQLPLEFAVRGGNKRERQAGGGQGDQDRDHKDRAEEAPHADAGGLERDDLEIARQTASRHQDGNQECHGQGVGQKRRQHEEEERQDEVKRYALGDDEIGQIVDPVENQEEGEEG